ncbi:MAG TPA: NAD(P)H-binding protein [Steroidobacteraceae bacterium]|nr:NAD(P)H-binding protein [Steroidobacteraceae bacterium]
MTGRCVFVTGATGYVGRALIPALLGRGHRVRALSRAASAARVPPGAEVILGDALVASSFAPAVAPADTLVHLVGTPHPSPAKAASFRAVDLVSAHAALDAALASGVRHFVYVSVAQPAPVMRAYIEVRQAVEARIRGSGIAATIVRPWYVLGPGHRWPYVLLPVYAVLARVPATRDSAQRLGLVTLAQMVAALLASIERGPDGERVLNVPDIRAARAA